MCLKFKDQTKESKVSYVLRKRWRPPHHNKCNCPRTLEARGWGDLSDMFSKTLICWPIWCSAARCLCQWLSMATMETQVFGQTSRARFISLLSESRINMTGTKLLKCITHISQPDLWIKDESIYGILVHISTSKRSVAVPRQWQKIITSSQLGSPVSDEKSSLPISWDL